MRRVVIFGAGGLGGQVLDILLQHPEFWSVAGFLDNDPALHGRTIDSVRVLGGVAAIDRLRWEGVDGAIVAIGHNGPRVRIAAQLEARGITLISAIHPLSNIAASACVGRHVILGPRATVCVHARIGAHTVISAGAIVEHDVELGEGAFVHPAARLAGGVKVGAEAVIGIGASVIPGRAIGARARIEPGAVVTRDVADSTVWGGVPARRRAGPEWGSVRIEVGDAG